MQPLACSLIRFGLAMNSAPEFHPFGSSHLVVIILTIAVPFVLALIVHRTKSPWLERSIRLTISSLLLINYVAYLIVARHFGVTHWYKTLPLQLCDWAMFVIIVALWTGNRRWLDCRRSRRRRLRLLWRLQPRLL